MTKMYFNRRRKKRPSYGLRTVEVARGSNGFGFTISGEQPCILSCIVANSPADKAGLRAGDFLISINGISVSKMVHDSVVSLIGNCVSPIQMTIAENYYSDSSDEELENTRFLSSRKPKYSHRPRPHCRGISKSSGNPGGNKIVNQEKFCEAVAIPVEEVKNPAEYKVFVGYLGTIEIPKQLLPNSKLETVCNCIKKLRQEKRAPTVVLITFLPTCLILKNSSNHILAIYPSNRVVYVGSSSDKETRYFGLVTSAVSDSENDTNANSFSCESDISHSCHIFVVESKTVDHRFHLERAEKFKISCTRDAITGFCLEFPQNALYIVNLIQTIYKLPIDTPIRNDLNIPLVANSPQPSASSNSDSGIGYRDDCGNISDRILVVEFPIQHSLSSPIPVINNAGRPQGIDGLDLPLDELETLSGEPKKLNNLYLKLNTRGNEELKHLKNLNNIRACENNNDSDFSNSLLQKQNNILRENNQFTSNAFLDFNVKSNSSHTKNIKLKCQESNNSNHFECPVDVPCLNTSYTVLKNIVNPPSEKNVNLKSSFEGVMQVSKSLDYEILLENQLGNQDISQDIIFKTPFQESKKINRSITDICENAKKAKRTPYDKLSPKVYGLSKINHSCEELSKPHLYDEVCYGSLQNLSKDMTQTGSSGTLPRREIAQSEPDIRGYCHFENCDQNGGCNDRAEPKSRGNEGPMTWAASFEKLLENRIGLHAFAEFLKKEFSAENIYFWTACERYKHITSLSERLIEAQRIFKQHLCTGAPEAVNVDSHGRLTTEQGLAKAEVNLFDLAQKQIFNLMKFDSYPRFLKSQLYKLYLSGEVVSPPLDPRLSLHNSSLDIPNTPSRLKKSLSNAEDRRRKSLLPWHRRNSGIHRSKPRDIDRNNDVAVTQKSWDGVLTSSCIEDRSRFSYIDSRDIHSSHSSLTSLDLAVSQDSVKPDSTSECRPALCRILLSNGSTTVVQIKDDETIYQFVSRLLEKRGLNYSAFEVFTNKHPKALDTSESSNKLSGCEVTVEQRVLFKLDLPNKKIISVKSKYTKIIVDVLRPILNKYKFSLDEVTVTNGGCPVDVTLPVTTIDNARLNIQLKEDLGSGTNISNNPAIKVSNVKMSKLEEIANKVFEGIFQDKADEGIFKPPASSDRGSVKSEDWGSEHSSGLLEKFLKRDFAFHERKKKAECQKYAASGELKEDSNADSTSKKPLIAKLKLGANKLHVGACSESDELVEGLRKAQRRLEDQKGTEINFELPDFLKDKNEENPQTSQLNPSEQPNRYLLPSVDCQPKVAITKTLKSSTQPSASNTQLTAVSSPTKSTKVLENLENRSPKMEPPPLPPKPKVIPIKPPNWGHKTREAPVEQNNELFLEQTSSSFV